MSEETPMSRLRKLMELVRKLPDDIEILMAMAEEDEEVRNEVAEFMVELLRIQSLIMVKTASIVARRAIGYGVESGTG